MELNLLMRDFLGTVALKDWLRSPDGAVYQCVTGRITILRDEEIVGFRTRGNESNWVAYIAGAAGGSLTILGCQIRAIFAHGPGESPDSLHTLVVR